MKDRRLNPRAPLETPVECRLAQTKGSLKARSCHLSAGGIGIIVPAELPVGAALSSVRFKLPAEDQVEETTIELGAQVVRCEPASDTGQFVAGLQFLDASRSDLERVEEYVFRRMGGAQPETAAEGDGEPDKQADGTPGEGEEIELDAPDGTEEDQTRPARRIPFSQPISIRYNLFKDFVQEVSANLSTTGMFIQTSQPREIGSVLEFSFDMGDDFTLLQGSGEVVWVREKREGPDLPAGMGIRFTELDASSRNVIERMVADHTALGHKAFDLEGSAPADLPLAAADAADAADAAPESEGEVVELEEVNPELRDRLQALLRAKHERDELLQRLKKSESEKYALEKELAGIGAGAQKAQIGWKARLAELETTVQQAESVETDLKGKLEELERSLAAAIEERDHLSTQHDAVIAERDEISDKLSERDAAADASEAEARDKQAAELESLQTKLTGLEAELEKARGEVEAARGEVASLEKDRERLESKIDEDASLLAAARESADTLDSTRADLEAQLAAAGETQSELNQRVSELETEMDSIKQEAQLNLEQSGADRAELKGKLDKALEEVDRLLSQRGDRERELEAEAEEKATAVREEQERRQQLESELAEATALADDRKAATSDLEAKLDASMEKENELSSKLGELENELKTALKEGETLEVARQTEAALREEIATLTSGAGEEKAGLEKQLAAAAEKEADLREELAGLRAENEAALEKATQDESGLQSRIEELETELAAASSSLAHTENQFEDRLAELARELEAERAATVQTQHVAVAELGDGSPEGASDDAGDQADRLPYPSSPAAGDRRRPWMAAAGPGLAAGLLLGALATFAWHRYGEPQPPGSAEATPVIAPTSEPSPAADTRTDSAQPTADVASGTSEPPASPAIDPAQEAAAGPAATSERAAADDLPDPTAAAEAVRSWATAWSDQRVDDYLSHYAPDFAPADGTTRALWEEQRRVRVARPASLEVTVRDLEQEVLAPDRVAVSFNQTYQSDTFGDVVDKTLELVWVDDAWKIVSEVSSPS